MFCSFDSVLDPWERHFGNWSIPFEKMKTKGEMMGFFKVHASILRKAEFHYYFFNLHKNVPRVQLDEENSLISFNRLALSQSNLSK